MANCSRESRRCFWGLTVVEGKVPVTVLIPCFNCAASIRRALASVLSQTVCPSEFILIDDASSDATGAILQEFADAHPGWVSLLRFQQNQGVASARNAGWRVARHHHIAFLDADDVWHPRKIEVQYAYMQAHPEVVLCSHGHRVIGHPDTRADWSLASFAGRRIGRWSLLWANRFITPSVMLRRDIEQRFVEGQRYMEDRLLWLEIVCDGGRVDMLEADLAATYKMPYGASGLSSNLWGMTLSDMANYRHLRSSHQLSWLVCQLLVALALLKYFRRLVKVAYWQVRAGGRDAGRQA